MELQQDWKGFQNTFLDRRRTSVLRSQQTTSDWIVVLHENRVIQVCSEEGWSNEFAGLSPQEIQEKAQSRKIKFLDAAKIDSAVAKLDGCAHFFEETELLRSELGLQSYAPPHFLLSLLKSRWKRMLPTTFGLFVRLEGQRERDLFAIVRNGKFEIFHEPDLTGIAPHRVREHEEVVKILSERHLLPVIGIFAPFLEWQEWSKQAQPWADLFRAIRKKRVKIAPRRFDLLAMIWLKSRGI